MWQPREPLPPQPVRAVSVKCVLLPPRKTCNAIGISISVDWNRGNPRSTYSFGSLYKSRDSLESACARVYAAERIYHIASLETLVVRVHSP